MKNKELILALLCFCCLQMQAQKPYCIHLKNGNQQVFYTHLVDSMTLTVPPQRDGIPYLQVWTTDSVHWVDVEDIDSLSFKVPPVLQTQDVKLIESTFAVVSAIYNYVPTGAICGMKYWKGDEVREQNVKVGGDGKYTLILSGLEENTTYSYQPFVRSEEYTCVGQTKKFTTYARARGEDTELWVDLGLSVKWAAHNIGASAPEEKGLYFAWGEVAPKMEYTLENCVNYEFETDCCGMIEYDAATANWGDGVHLPTFAQVDELLKHCTSEWITLNGMYGYQLTSKVNGNSIFIPAAGYRAHGDLFLEGLGGYYWTSSPCTDNHSYSLDLTSIFGGRDWSYRSLGHTIRPVKD